MSNQKVLYIPDYVLPSDIPLIKQKFKENKLGKVIYVELADQIECEYKVDKDIYCAAYVYLNWYNTPESDSFQEDIFNENIEAKLIYNEEGDYWIFEDCKNEFQQNFNNQNFYVENLKNDIENISNILKIIENYNYYNCNALQYILEKDRKAMIKKKRLEKSKITYKKNILAQRKWRNRLRPKSVLKTFH